LCNFNFKNPYTSKMSGGGSKQQRKQDYFEKMVQLLDEFQKVLVVEADNVGSNHLQKIRIALRGQAHVLMGKNTMMRKVIRLQLEKNKNLEALMNLIRGNVGLIFTNNDLAQVREKVESYKVAAPAKAGTPAPNDVWVPKGPTGMEPTQTSFLQALNIPSKINKGQIEIINDVHLIKKGQKVGNSEATLLTKLSIKPFSYGLVIRSVYDNGSVYDPTVLDITEEQLIKHFGAGVANIACIGLATGYATIASVPHSLINGYKNVLSVALELDISFPAVEKLKAALANPGAYAAAATTTAAATTDAPAEEEKKEEEEEEDVGVGDLFGW